MQLLSSLIVSFMNEIEYISAIENVVGGRHAILSLFFFVSGI